MAGGALQLGQAGLGDASHDDSMTGEWVSSCEAGLLEPWLRSTAQPAWVLSLVTWTCPHVLHGRQATAPSTPW